MVDYIDLTSDDDEGRISQQPSYLAHMESRLPGLEMIEAQEPRRECRVDNVSAPSAPSYDIRYEKQKQLKTTLTPFSNVKSFTEHVFIPLGQMQHTLIDYCKEKSRNSGETMIVVTDSWQHDGSASAEVSRVGYLFPKAIVQTASTRIARRQTQLETFGNTRTRRRTSSSLAEPKTLAEVEQAIKDVFPKMPDKEVKQVIKRAWRNGRIGRARDKSLVVRIHLAVSSYIRHEYTDYDKILDELSLRLPRQRTENRTWAREQLQSQIVDRLKKYRGEDDEQLQEAWREVIVIEDDSEDDDDQPLPAKVLTPGTKLYSEDGEEITVGGEDIALPSVEERGQTGFRPFQIPQTHMYDIERAWLQESHPALPRPTNSGRAQNSGTIDLTRVKTGGRVEKPIRQQFHYGYRH